MMTPFVFDPKAEAVEQEIQVISWFRNNPPKNPKKLLKMVQFIYNQVPEFIQKSFCNVLLSPHTKDKMKTLQQYFHEMDNVPQVIAEIKRAGNHGMVIHKGKTYGISLKAQKNWLRKDDIQAWTPEQEEEIATEALDAWMIEHCVKHFNEKVVLFSQFGFSGVSHLFDVTMDDESFEEAKRLKLIRELAYYSSIDHVPEK